MNKYISLKEVVYGLFSSGNINLMTYLDLLENIKYYEID